MTGKIERVCLGLLLAPLAPLAFFMLGWWAAFEILPEDWIPAGVLICLAMGILVDILILKKLIERVDKLGMVFWTAVYLFYSVGVFGFFMGVPVFNTLLSIPAGFVVGRKLATERADLARLRSATRHTAWFSTGILGVVCTVSAVLALASKSTAADLQGMLGLGFQVTPGMILGLILVGGIALLAASWGMAFAAVRFSFTFFKRPA